MNLTCRFAYRGLTLIDVLYGPLVPQTCPEKRLRALAAGSCGTASADPFPGWHRRNSLAPDHDAPVALKWVVRR